MKADFCQRFLFERHDIRGELVHLASSFQTIVAQHQYPSVIRQLLGESLVAVVLLAETIKFNGQITVQFQSDGPVSLLVAKCTHDGFIRGLVQWDDKITPIDVMTALGDGQLVVTIEYDQKTQPYQSIIPIHRQTVTQALEAYFNQSEQLPTRLYIHVTEQAALGMLLQAMPASLQSDNLEPWHEVTMLADTITQDELATLDSQTILHRLFHEHDVRLFDPKAIAFRCTCSQDRMREAIRMLGQAEAMAVIEEKQVIDVTCEYCNQSYAFSRMDIETLFNAG